MTGVNQHLVPLLEQATNFLGEKVLVATPPRIGRKRAPYLFCFPCGQGVLAKVSGHSGDRYCWDWLAEMEPRGFANRWRTALRAIDPGVQRATRSILSQLSGLWPAAGPIGLHPYRRSKRPVTRPPGLVIGVRDMRGFKFKRRDTTAPPLDMFDPEAIAYRLRPCLALAIVALLGDLIQHQFVGSAEAYQTLPCDLLQLTSCFAFASFTYRRQFADRWRQATFGFCMFFVLAAVWSGVRLGEQVPLFVTILVLMTATCALVPWEPRWQNGLTAALFAAAAIDTIAVRPPSPHLGMLWLGALAASALALESNRLWNHWRKEETATRPESGGGRMQRLLDADLSQPLDGPASRRALYLRERRAGRQHVASAPATRSTRSWG